MDQAEADTMVVGKEKEKGKGKGKGKRKIEITRIVEKPRRGVTFSKRRKGLFKKSAELDVLCGSDTAIISVSEAGTIFAAGRPSFVHGLLLGSAGGGGVVEFDYGRLERMGWDELAAELAAVNKSQLKIQRLMMEKRNNNNNNSDFTGGSELAAFSSAAASVDMSEKAHVFVDAAAAGAPPDMLAATPSSSSEIDWSSWYCSSELEWSELEWYNPI